MREYIDVTGKNEEEAIAKALEQLGMDRDDVSVEILERAKSGFLGLGSSPAKVRVSYGEEEEIELPKVENTLPPTNQVVRDTTATATVAEEVVTTTEEPTTSAEPTETTTLTPLAR